MDIIDYRNASTLERLLEAHRSLGEVLAECQAPAPITDETATIVEKKESSKEHNTCIFERIIVFTNNTNPKENKSLRLINEATKDFKVEVHAFNVDEVDTRREENKIIVWDGDNELVLEEASNIDTLVISRLGVQGELDAEHAVKVLQDRGILVLNPVYYSSIACNKYETAKLLEAAKIPQPRFCYMDYHTLYDEELYAEAIHRLFPKAKLEDKDSLEELEVVVKILDGHGGTGVFTCDVKKLYAILQCVFAVDSERGLIIQKKEEADGGDIRVHVLTLRGGKQKILAVMKRVKLSGDFRSNVSLGATAEPIKLTKEQEKIALDTAKVSKLPWCAVDIMPLVENSNPELGDNVVLEINASPGTEGISEVIKENFINVLLNNLTSPEDFPIQSKIAGTKETAHINFGGKTKEYLAKLDTGNATTFCSLEVGKYKVKGDKVTFSIDGKDYTFDVVDTGVSLTGDEKHERPVIEVPSLRIGERKVRNCRIGIVESRDNKSTNLLVNRKTIAQLGYVINADEDHILTPAIEKVAII